MARSAVGLVASPILVKELTVSSRRRRTYWLRATYLLLLVASLLFAWWVMAQGSLSQSAAEMLQRQSQTGQGLSLTLGWIQLIALILVAPMLTGSCISDEVEDRSLDVLLITPLTAGQIIVGKMLSRFVYVLLLVALGFPLLLAMRTYGGFTFEQLVRIEVLGATTALLGASVGMFLSCWEARGWRAVAMAYFWLGVWWFALPLVVVALAMLAGRLLGPYLPMLPPILHSLDWEAYPFLMLHVNPVLTMMLETMEASGGTPFAWATAYAWISVNTGNVVLSAVLVLVSIPLLRRAANKRLGAGDERTVRWLMRFLRPRRREAYAAAAPRAGDSAASTSVPPAAPPSAPSRPSREAPVHAALAELPVPKVWDNAVLWREMRLGFLRRPIAAAFISLLLVVLLVWYNIEGEVRRDSEMLIPLILLALLAQLVIACVVSPTVIASEKQARSWEVLLCAPVRPLTILWSKAAGSIKLTFIPLAIILLVMIYYSTKHSGLLLGSVLVAVFSVAFSTFLACTGTALSLLCRRNLGAMAANLGLAIGLWGVLPAGVGITSELAGWGGGAERAVGVTMLLNPFYWIAVVCDHVGSASYRDVPSFRLEFWDENLGVVEFAALTALVAAVTIGAGAGLLYVSSLWFNRVTGRAS
ncbi:MAG: ABC transporter permease subunit [Phycisphaerales bacterium]|nr:ABC transporter permease subunit [Phycisphaerales bacterium]